MIKISDILLEFEIKLAGSHLVPRLTADRVHCPTAIPESQGEWFLAENFDTKSTWYFARFIGKNNEVHSRHLTKRK